MRRLFVVLFFAATAFHAAANDRRDHVLPAVSNLGVFLHEQGDFEGAEPLYQQAVEANRQALGERHPQTLISMFALALLLGDKGDEIEAMAMCQLAVDGFKEALGEAHPYTQHVMNSNPWGIR